MKHFNPNSTYSSDLIRTVNPQFKNKNYYLKALSDGGCRETTLLAQDGKDRYHICVMIDGEIFIRAVRFNTGVCYLASSGMGKSMRPAVDIFTGKRVDKFAFKYFNNKIDDVKKAVKDLVRKEDRHSNTII